MGQRMRPTSSRDISMHVGYGDLRCSIVAEGVSWSPDVADDMLARMARLWDQTLLTAWQYELSEVDEEEYADQILALDEEGDE